MAFGKMMRYYPMVHSKEMQIHGNGDPFLKTLFQKERGLYKYR